MTFLGWEFIKTLREPSKDPKWAPTGVKVLWDKADPKKVQLAKKESKG